jgi:hypothetical protein
VPLLACLTENAACRTLRRTRNFHQLTRGYYRLLDKSRLRLPPNYRDVWSRRKKLKRLAEELVSINLLERSASDAE